MNTKRGTKATPTRKANHEAALFTYAKTKFQVEAGVTFPRQE